jgi:hypothetical protein
MVVWPGGRGPSGKRDSLPPPPDSVRGNPKVDTIQEMMNMETGYRNDQVQEVLWVGYLVGWIAMVRVETEQGKVVREGTAKRGILLRKI